MGRPIFSLFRQRAMSGLCVAWNPLIAPQAMVMKRQGKILSVNDGSCSFAILPRPSHSSGSTGILMRSITMRATAMKSREKENMGYILPIILSMGSIVATT